MPDPESRWITKPHRLPPGALDLARRRFAYRLLAQGEALEDVARALCSALGMSPAAAGRLAEDVQRRHLA